MHFLIYLISFLEGFTTLSIEIIAIRRFTPIIGTNSISTSIILGVILLALSYGYYIGGKNTKNLEEKYLIRKIIFNLVFASIYYLFFTFIFDKFILEFLIINTNNYFLSILVSSFLLFFMPVFFASQTIPLLSEVLKGNNTGEKIGKLLFFSTIGSFLGSVLTSSLFFPLIGVYKTSVLNSFILSIISVFLGIYIFKKYKKIFISSIFSVIILFSSLILIFSKNLAIENIIYKTANSYQDIEIYEQDGNRIFALNGGYSSGIDIKTKESFFWYIKEIKKNILKNNGKKILIIGAAGFTLPQELAKIKNISKIDVVDIDGDLKQIAEKYFLQEKLSEKINFIVEPSRYFLNNSIKNNKFYDEIVVDIYVGKSLPSQTLTEEFFKNIKKIGKNIYLNIITDKNLETDFSKNLFNTIQKSFGEVYYLDEKLNTNKKNYLTNIVVTNIFLEGYKKYIFDKNFGTYTDDKHSIEIDIFKRGL
ncbi:hypothetical protein DLH72_00360 [Candidatus Gracilibacteria bacterium]|nr:MAG: hypothetical protein DLH72_00360 [Candidatus Gracilibacteria bacterium]